MKTRSIAFAVASLFSIAAAVSLPALAAEGHAHAGHAVAGTKLTLNEGRKWATDAALRQGMSRIRTAFDSRHDAIHDASLSAEDSRALGREAEAQMAYIVSNCKLTPAADAQLHVVLGELQGSLDALAKSSGAGATRAAERALRALNTYGDYFDHPGWNAVSETRTASFELEQAIELVSQTYPGRVIAAQADAVGGSSMHYHVDLLLPNERVARFDVDAGTRRIFNRLPAEETPQGGLSLGDAVKKVKSETRGRVVSAEYDPSPAPHYHLNVRLPRGELTRLDLNVETGVAAAHQPRM